MERLADRPTGGMKIAIISYYAVTNIGDRILTETLSWLLRQRYHEVVVLDLQARYAYRFSGIIGVLERLLSKIFAVFNIGRIGVPEKYFAGGLSGVSAVVFGGGEIIDPRDKGIVDNVCTVIRMAERLNIPVYFNATGVASYSGCWLDELRRAFRTEIVRFISVRESADRFNRVFLYGSAKEALEVCDTAVWAACAYGILRAPRNSKYIGLNVISPVAFEKRGVKCETVIKTYQAIYNTLSENGYSCVLFTNGVTRDEKFLERLVPLIGTGCRVVYPDIPRDGKSFLRMLNKFDGVVSSRLHTSISAFSLQIPTVALSWDDKIEYFYKSISAGDRCFDLARVQTAHLASSILNLMRLEMPHIDQQAYCRSFWQQPFLRQKVEPASQDVKLGDVK